AGRIDAAREELSQAKLLLTDQGKLALVGAVDRVEKRAAVLSDRIRLASYGYSGVFDAAKVGEPELAALYAFDGGLFESAVSIAKLAMGVVGQASASGDVAGAVARADEAVSGLERRFAD